MTSATRRCFLIGSAAALVPCALRAADTPPVLRLWPKTRPTPALALPGYGGPAWSLASAKSRPVILNFWASWCEPCRTEMPSLELLAQRHEGDGLDVIAVNYRETDAAIRRFMEQLPFTLTIVRDTDGGAARDFGVRVFPTTVLIGRDGRAAYSVVGEVDWTGPESRRWMAALLQGP